MKRITLAFMMVAATAVCALVALPIYAGEYHVGPTLVCYDCHTQHFSMQHGFDSTVQTPILGSAGGAPNGNWLGSTGPNVYLLKAPEDALCLACHDGQTFAPDVMELDTNNLQTTGEGRSAGALNRTTSLSPYDTWKGHTIGNVGIPPGYNAAIPGTAAGLDATYELKCTSCHATHGAVSAYRNLTNVGGHSYKAGVSPTFTVATSHTSPCVSAINNQTGIITTSITSPVQGANGCDVWINIDQASYTAGTSNFVSAGYYDTKNIYYNRNDVLGSGATSYSNAYDQFCGQCHSAFHGGADAVTGNQTSSPSVGWQPAIGSDATGFLRHPTGTVSLGGGITSLSQYNAGQTRVKAYDSVPQGSDTGTGTALLPAVGCVSCHKAHGNQNPFGLIFMARAKAPLVPGPITEQGSWSTADTHTVATGYRNLCGQCHSLGN